MQTIETTKAKALLSVATNLHGGDAFAISNEVELTSFAAKPKITTYLTAPNSPSSSLASSAATADLI